MTALGRPGEATAHHRAAVAKAQALVDHAAKNHGQAAVVEAVGDELAGFYNEYAWHLVTLDNATAAQATEALALAELANQLAIPPNGNYIDTRAHALAALGRFCDAANDERLAVTLETDPSRRGEFSRKVADWAARCRPVP